MEYRVFERVPLDEVWDYFQRFNLTRVPTPPEYQGNWYRLDGQPGKGFVIWTETEVRDGNKKTPE